jgi:G3E family GTPase
MSQKSGTGASSDARIPVNVLTGFLGSGKTTLLKRLLSSETFRNCAVLINELGEIGLDHHLLDVVDQETVVLSNGCICCGMRSDLAAALLDLNEKRERGLVPSFNRVMLETTGLADPVAVLNTVFSDAKLRHHFRVATVITTVDAMFGMRQLAEHRESFQQAAIADRVVITKADLADDAVVGELRAALESINPSCRIVISRNDASEHDVLIEDDASAPCALKEATHWFFSKSSGIGGKNAGPSLFGSQSRPLGPMHVSTISTASLMYGQPLDWTAFGVWLSMLVHGHGEKILRMKGLLNIKGSDTPVVVHGVHHLIHPPVHLDAWPTDDRRSRLVLIGNLPPVEQLQRSFEQFNES